MNIVGLFWIVYLRRRLDVVRAVLRSTEASAVPLRVTDPATIAALAAMLSVSS